jgi:hypothetical protein
MTTLLVSGDSWTSCWPLEERLGHRQFGWPNLIASHFKFDLVDKSRAGTSNYRIFRKAFNGILQQPDLAIVFLTSWVRFETGGMYGNKPGGIYQHMLSSKDHSPHAFKLFFNGYKNYVDMLHQILSLQALAIVRKVPCFFLDTFNDNLYRDISLNNFTEILKYNPAAFDSKNDAQIASKFETVKMLEANVDWSMFISDKSYQSLINGYELDQHHPTQNGHAKIASVVINFLESKNYGKTI